MTTKMMVTPKRKRMTPCLLVLLALAVAIGTGLLFAALSFPSQKDLKNNWSNSHHHHHRRLVGNNHVTLPPAAKAAIHQANEMARERARDEGHAVNDDDNMEKNFRKQQHQGSNDNDKGDDDKITAMIKATQDTLIHGKDLKQLKKNTDWSALDPLGIHNTNDNNNKAVIEELTPPQVEYLGVMVDAAQNYFDIPWLKRLIVYLHKLKFNLIHLRLTDDENFMVRLKSYPQLQYSVSSGDFYYTPQQLNELVAFAKQYNVVILPEISVPLRAASWAGIPGLVVACPNFICESGQSVPLNIHHDQFPSILTGVLKEIVEIFDSPSMLHLGGTSARHGDRCMQEADETEGVDWNKFEDILQKVLKDIGYPEDRVVRSEHDVGITDDDGDDAEKEAGRVGGIVHYWYHVPDTNDETKTKKSRPYILTTGLDFTMDHDDNALTIYSAVVHAIALPEKPKAIVVGTLYLSPEFWWQRNVASRLIAVSMGAGIHESEEFSISHFASSYKTTCQSVLGKASAKYCDLQGHTAVFDDDYVDAQLKQVNELRKTVCRRLTYSEKRRAFKPYKPSQKYTTELGNDVFWRTFHKPVTPKSHKQEPVERHLKEQVRSLGKRRVEKAGVILDLTTSLERPERVQQILETYVAALDLNMLQLRLVTDKAFAVRLDSQRSLENPPLIGKQEDNIISVSKFIPIVEKGSALGVDVFPEISITTSAGGFVKGGFLVQCPLHFCQKGEAIPNDIRVPEFLPVVYSVLRELREVFSTSPHFHLGADDRVDNLKCFVEAGMTDDEDPPYGAFEAKLKKVVMMLGIQPENILRYDNSEQLSYDDRVGAITHYRVWDDPDSLPDIREEEPYFVTGDILEGNSIYGVYKRTRDLVGLKPVGMMGEIRELDAESWKEKHTGMRLIAFVMGLSEGAELSHEDFNEQILNVCKVLKLPEYRGQKDCKSAKEVLEKDAEEEDEKTDMPEDGGDEDQLSVRDKMCARFTREKSSNFMKDDFVLAKKAI